MKQAAIALTVLMILSATAFGVSVLIENIHFFGNDTVVDYTELSLTTEVTVIDYVENADPDIVYSVEFNDNDNFNYEYGYDDTVVYAVTTSKGIA